MKQSPQARSYTLLILAVCALQSLTASFASAAESSKPITEDEMRAVYEEVKTPFKYGIVLRPSDGELVDCPNVFRHGDKWYMTYVASKNNVGYETYLAESDNLLDWKPLGKILPFSGEGWDRWQADGSIALVDPIWKGSSELQQFDGKYWMSYFGGDKQGYETDPLSIGLAWTTTPTKIAPWHRLAENPVLTPLQDDARPFEKATLYKSQILWDRSETLGSPFVMFYNGKQQGRGTERIGMAVSNDMVHWKRFGDGPVIDNGSGISGDPQIVRMGDLWVMFYFGAFWKPAAFDTFACSRDLVNWTKWDGPHLIEPSEPWDKTFAHKPWILKHDGVVYHFYCAVGNEGRAIALATSRDMRAGDATLHPANLKCEYAANPLGVDVAKPRLYWTLESGIRGARQSAYQILVASSPKLLAQDVGDLWDSGKVASNETTHIPYDGKPLASSLRAYWKVRTWDANDTASPWSGQAEWTMGIIRDKDWQAKWIVAPWSSESVLMRREFDVKPGLKRALAHITGLGQFEMSVNGRKSGTNLLSPGWTKYNRTALYETHDITPLVKEGEKNTVGLTLGDGMYHTERRNRFSKFQGSFGPQRAFGQIELEYDDGTREVIGTDEAWRVSAGPVTYNDIFGGEDYDARKAQPGWDKPGFDDAAWAEVVELVRPSGTLRGLTASAPPLGAIESIRPVAMNAKSETQDVIDFGQNASFMPRIRVTGPAGSSVRLTHAEVVDREGNINRGTCGGNRGPAYWQHTKSTDDPETWFPQFFYAGCRYLQADKFPAETDGDLPQIDQIEGVVVHSVADPIGEFECSNELLNRIRMLVRWAQRSNMVSVLTDCPHREKLGWLEQYHLNGPAIRYEFDVNRIFNKGMRDMADSQTEDGLIPNIAPEFTVFPGTFRAASEWGCAFIFVPWQQYLFTGDTALMSAYYGQMQKYMDYLAARSTDHILDEGLGDWYDLGPADRPGFAQLTPPPVTATAFYYYDAQLMAKIAGILGQQEDAAKYAELAKDIRAAWLKKFRNADGIYATNSQCSNAIALVMDLAEPADREKALAALAKDVKDRGNAMTAGDVGFRYLLQALADGGQSDLIYAMINQDERPGYGYQLKKGATSLTEAWDANHHASHNHFMLGHITEWFYKDLVGIDADPAAPGFKHIVIKPTPVGDLEWAGATYNSVRGPITVRWDRKDGKFKLRAVIPANTTATVYLPAAADSPITESANDVADAEGVKFVGRQDDRNIYNIESGTYDFESEF